MRTSLLPGLVAALAAQPARQQARVRLFELGNVFRRTRNRPTGIGNRTARRYRRAHRGSGLRSRGRRAVGRGARTVDFYDLKGDVESLLALTDAAARIPGSPPRRLGCIPAKPPNCAVADATSAASAPCIPDLRRRSTSTATWSRSSSMSRRSPARAVPAPSSFRAFRRSAATSSFVAARSVPYAQVEAAIRAAVGDTLRGHRPVRPLRGPESRNGAQESRYGLDFAGPFPHSYRRRTRSAAWRSRSPPWKSVCTARLRG